MSNNVSVSVSSQWGSNYAYVENLSQVDAKVAELSASFPSGVGPLSVKLKLTAKGKKAGIKLPA